MGAIAGHNTQLFITSVPSVSLTDEALTDSGDHATFNDGTAAHQMWDKSAAFTVQTEYDDVQTVTITGSPTGGTFTLTFGGNTTTGIAFNATAATVQAALQALASIGASNALVTGSAGGPYTVDFTGALAYASQSLLTKNAAGLTGGTSPNVAIARAQAGQTWTTVTTGFVINYPIGQIVFSSPFLGAAPACRAHAGKYFPFSFLGFCTAAALGLIATTLDTTSFVTPVSPWKTFIAGVNGGTIKLSKWWIDGTFLAHMTANDLLIIQIAPGQNANQRYQGYGVLSNESIKSAVNAVVSDDLDFDIDGQLFFIAS